MQDALDSLHRFHAAAQRFTLDNGMTVLLRPDAAAPVVSVQIWVAVGSIHEQEFLGAGLSHFIEHMIFKGTPTRPVGQITREIDDAGGHVNAYTSFDRTVFHTDMPAAGWKTGLHVLADAVQNAAFPADEWEREREVVLREVAMGRDDPNRVLQHLLWRTAFTTHPYRFPVIGLPDVLKQVERADILAFFQRNYVPDKMIVVLTGDFDPAEGEAEIRARFADFNRKPNAPIVLPAEPPQIAPRAARQEGPFNVTRLVRSWHTVPLSHPDAAALDLLADIVGSGRSSRLVRNLLERRALVDQISAFSYTPKEAGLFAVSATFPPEKEALVREALDAEWHAWLETPFTPAEIAKARRNMVVQTLAGLETAHGHADSLASGEFYAADFRFAARYLERLEAVTPESLRDVLVRYLRPETQTEVTLAPVSTAPAAPPAATPGGGAVQRFVLSNGAVLLVREDTRLPFVHVCAAFRGGVLQETESDNGIYRLLSELLTRGTTTRSSEDIADTLENLGAELGAFSGFNSFGLKGRALKGDLPVLLDVLADCAMRARFPAEEVGKQKALQLAAIRQQRERPMFTASRNLFEGLFRGHPFRLDPNGVEDSLAALGPDRLTETYRRACVAGNMVIALFGDIPAGEARALAEKAFAGMPRAATAPTAPNPPTPELPGRIETPLPKEQSIILIGYPSAPLRDPRRDPLRVLQTALSGLSSSLMDEIREKRGLAYYAGAYERVAPEIAAFVLYAGTRDDALGEVETLLRAEMKRIRETGLTAAELDRAQAQIVSEFQMSLQDNTGLAFTCTLDELLGLGADHVFSTEARIRAVTADDIRQAAAGLLVEPNAFTSLVRPAAKGTP